MPKRCESWWQVCWAWPPLHSAGSCSIVSIRMAPDFHWAIYLAQRLVARQNPYDTSDEQYPLPAALVALPFLRLPPDVAAGLFYGISSFLLALALTRENFNRLPIFPGLPPTGQGLPTPRNGPPSSQPAPSSPCLLPRNHDETASRIARFPHPALPARPDCLCCARRGKPSGVAPLADHVVPAKALLPALFPLLVFPDPCFC